MSNDDTLDSRTKRQLLAEIDQLRTRLHEVEQASAVSRIDVAGSVHQHQGSTRGNSQEAALTESEEKYRLLFENMAEGFAIYELLYDDQGQPVDWRILEVNDAYSLHTGLARDRIVGHRMSELFPAAIAEYLPLFAEVVASQSATEFETYSVATNRHQRVTCIPAGPGRFANTVIDISKRKQAEAALRAFELKASALINAADESIWLFGLQGEVLAANATAARRMGMAVEEVIGKHWPDYLPANLVESRGRKIDELLRSGESVHFEDERAGILFDHSAHPVRDESGAITAVAFFSRDITARKRNEEELLRRTAELEAARVIEENNRLLLEAVMEALPIGVAIVDASGGIIRSNSAYERIWGNPLPPTQSVDDYGAFKAWWADSGKPVAPEEWASAIAVQKGETTVGQLVRIQRFDDSEAFVINSASPFRNAEGAIVGCAVAIQDITLLKRTEAELQTAKELAERATRAKSQFLANMSHELRTPMTGVLAMLDLVLGGAINAEQRECLQLASKSAHLLLKILNDILDLSKIEADKLSLEYHPFALANCIEDTVNLLLPIAQSKGITLTYRIEENIPQAVNGDQLRLYQVLSNLLGNAIKFTEQGRVELNVSSAADDPSRLTFAVTDTGIGISEEKQELLFKPFSQADNSHSRRFGGTGLGLAISMQLVEKMGGSISCQSREGEGATFFVTIPLAEAAINEVEAVADDAGESTASTLPMQQNSARLLVAEDNEVIRFAFEKLFNQEGFVAEFAVNGKEVLEKWSTGNYDLIIMDVQMPLVDGFDATRIIREAEQKRGGHIPILAMTGYAFKEDADKCYDAGMDAYLSKPIDFRKLLRVVSQMLKSAQ
jgi:PAS domain S-box-containing protein